MTNRRLEPAGLPGRCHRHRHCHCPRDRFARGRAVATLGEFSGQNSLSHPFSMLQAQALVSLRHGHSEQAIPPIGGAVIGVVMVVAVLSSRSSSLRTAVVDGAQRLSLDMSAFIAVLVDFDMSGEWAFDNAPTCAHWVADRADVELCTVREWLRIGHALRVCRRSRPALRRWPLVVQQGEGVDPTGRCRQSTRTLRDSGARPRIVLWQRRWRAGSKTTRAPTTLRNATGRRPGSAGISMSTA